MDISLWIDFSAFALVGAFAGFIAGLLGIGGGMVIVPALIFLLPAFGVDPSVLTQVAVGSSLGCIAVISINSTRAHQSHGGVRWLVFARLAPGMVCGSLLGAALAHFLPSLVLQRIIGVAALLVAVKMSIGGRPAAGRELPGPAGLVAVGGVIGGLSSLIGIGGGSLTVPFLSWCSVPMRRAVGTSAACGMPIAWSGAIGFVISGWGIQNIGMASVGYIGLPPLIGVAGGSLLLTPLGARWAHRLPASTLRRVFAVLLVVAGIRMLMG